ncbi:MAG: zinc finger domain-containing protein [Nanoarchaeota archaeon]
MECISCGENTAGVKFPCPECGKELFRCKKCRTLSIEYKCSHCGYSGP